LSRHLLEHDFESGVRETLLVICRRMWEHSDTLNPRSGTFREFTGHALDVIDWFDHEHPQFDKNQKSSSWTTIYERAHEWHEEQRRRIEREAEERRRAEEAHRAAVEAGALAARRHWNAQHNAPWGTVIDRYKTNDGFEVVPLLTGAMLEDEGNRMRHCVGGYSGRCREGQCRIFSIRTAAGVSQATIEIGPSASGPWVVRQIRGEENAAVSDRLAAIGNQLLASWERARVKGQEELVPEWTQQKPAEAAAAAPAP
jgi:hypothetical protein